MTYRTGNLYRGDEYIGVMFDPADTALIVDAMEGADRCGWCDHAMAMHRPDGCWFTVLAGEPGANLVCVCIHPGDAEDAPSAALSQPVSAAQPSGAAESTPDPSKAAQGECDCGHEGLDDWFHLRPCPVAERRASRRIGRDCACPRHADQANVAEHAEGCR